MKTAPPPPSPAVMVQQLHQYGPRLIKGALDALALYEVWNTLNTPSAARDAVVASPTTKAIGVMWEATLDKLVLVLMRSLDQPGPKGLHGSNRVSFPVCLGFIDAPGVLDMLAGDATSGRDPTFRDAQRQAVVDAASGLRDRLARLDAESPNRARRLRQIRDRFIAHQLHLTEPIDAPIYENLRTTTDEILKLASDLQRVLVPSVIVWPHGTVAADTKILIRTIADRFPVRPAEAG